MFLTSKTRKTIFALISQPVAFGEKEFSRNDEKIFSIMKSFSFIKRLVKYSESSENLLNHSGS